MNVKIIQKENGNALIEWVDEGQYHRSIVPLESVVDNQTEHPEWGIEYGEDWAALVGQIDAGELANELRRRGIWTKEDLRQHHKAALGAVMHVAGQVLAGLASRAPIQR
jgi:hypothetical protein